ncbi:hypothetical protein BDZ94DRAFT_1253080 [Collybia nuda]|uniref:Uncharacterized protein n=1 Tax=Collybia nuda TaxID=64659 RepID=A0A9P6CGW7_9AGAR|nr:hypothetical protein BDZ94DRAFT_1253080 [Collybia nuda]
MEEREKRKEVLIEKRMKGRVAWACLSALYEIIITGSTYSGPLTGYRLCAALQLQCSHQPRSLSGFFKPSWRYLFPAACLISPIHS